VAGKYSGWTRAQLTAEVSRLRAEMKSDSPKYSSSYYRTELRVLARILESRNGR
jgi:hypothetical protein